MLMTLRLAVVALALGGTAGCYYVHTIRGQLDVMSRRETVLDLRDFASDELALPDNDSYRIYADLGRPYVAWNVFAAPEFSLEATEWCYFIIGCVTYRGYFDEAKAEDFAAGLEEDGLDVFVGPVPAYSTLGHFDDPVLNTMLYWDDAYMASIIFHELAHQLLYVKGDAGFSEAFAGVVGDVGVQRWLKAEGRDALLDEYEAARRKEEQFVELVEEGRERLREVYASELSPEAMRRAKAREVARIAEDYAGLVESWDGFDVYGPWFDGGVNNAKLVSIATYNDFAPAFRELLSRCLGELACLYERAAELADLPMEERHERLRDLTAANGESGREHAAELPETAFGPRIAVRGKLIPAYGRPMARCSIRRPG